MAKIVVFIVLAVCVLVLARDTLAQTPGVWADCQASPSVAYGHEGQWQYSLRIDWDLSGLRQEGAADVTVALGLSDCDCACDLLPGGEHYYFQFDYPAGSSTSRGGATVPYAAELLQYGDPARSAIKGPAIRFTPNATETEPASSGSAELCFYSWFPPTGEAVFQEAVTVVAGTETVWYGDLTGVLPRCDCGSVVRDVSFGTVKSIYR